MPSCTGNGDCYSPKCPHKEAVENLLTRHHSSVSTYHEQPKQRKRNWVDNVEPEILLSLTPSEVARQEAIHMLILGEEQYHEDLMTIETVRYYVVNESAQRRLKIRYFHPALRSPCARGRPTGDPPASRARAVYL